MEEREFSDFAFDAFLAEEKFMGGRCRSCGAIYAPPRALCPQCFTSAMEWVAMKGGGTLLAFTCIHFGTSRMQKEGFDRKNPYCVGVVGLEEGGRITARILGVDARHPEEIRIGMPLKAAFVHTGEGEEKASHLAFTPA